jgi:hypothetical protein
MTTVEFLAVDADEHYYEATDAFTRHLEPEFARRAMQWATIDGRQRLLVGGRVNRFIPNPTFDPVAKPGSLDEYFRGRNPKGASVAELFGDLEPIRPEYRDRNARLAVMDGQGVEAAFFFPSVRVASIELGSDWVFSLWKKLKKSFGQAPKMYPEDPRETFRRHVSVSPYYEDDLGALRDLIGASQILMGSDWPHAEGLADPISYIDDLRRFDIPDDECRLIMRENAAALTRPRVAVGA